MNKHLIAQSVVTGKYSLPVFFGKKKAPVRRGQKETSHLWSYANKPEKFDELNLTFLENIGKKNPAEARFLMALNLRAKVSS